MSSRKRSIRLARHQRSIAIWLFWDRNCKKALVTDLVAMLALLMYARGSWCGRLLYCLGPVSQEMKRGSPIAGNGERDRARGVSSRSMLRMGWFFCRRGIPPIVFMALIARGRIYMLI